MHFQRKPRWPKRLPWTRRDHFHRPPTPAGRVQTCSGNRVRLVRLHLRAQRSNYSHRSARSLSSTPTLCIPILVRRPFSFCENRPSTV